ncbi:two-component system activity regulator YycH [Natranaerobius thermophilus]|uniref:Regulatory protein YycH domain-containing protein n=1 Tax=Natranaerobius thermophilus (strain ATCC BAA-1301 / DSM 18059 / JW/NM-WN-LF) TaxID=457570 RepID=B2A442_NATTJ|nr:two-component system activity regulator YycH [Natranaerobius thermophilus]ACB86448.1 hypothetical protein Nther_2901 [Natranaerobius thermophilus JW/NM-WN-LF]
MNWEQIKTVLLVILVINSIFLTSRLWVTDYHYERSEEPNIEEITYGDNPELFQQVKPEKIVYHANEQIFLLRRDREVYEQVWKLFWDNIITGENFTTGNIKDKESLELTKPYFIYKFSGVSPLNLMLNGEYGLPSNYDEEYSDLLVTLDENPQIYLVDNGSQDGYPVNMSVLGFEEFEQEELEKRNLESGQEITSQDIAEIFYHTGQEYLADIEDLLGQVPDSISKEWYEILKLKSEEIHDKGYTMYLPTDKELENLDLIPQVLNFEEQNKEKLAKAFFLDLSFVRKIEERDGTTIYTDGQRGLRFYPDGGLQYNAPQTRDSIRTADSNTFLDRGGRFISLYGGWVDNLKAAQLTTPSSEFQDSTYNLTEINYLYYHHGFPILNEFLLNISMADNKLVEYFRHIPESFKKLDKEEGNLVEIQEIIKNWIAEELYDGGEELSFDIEQEQDLQVLTKELEKQILDAANKLKGLDNITLGYELQSAEGENEYYILPVWNIESGDESKNFPAWNSSRDSLY